ncbi:hypothetical protein FPV67DRAFT_1473294 [Lyophyllum atratum]|nr:hypothetical protein FPV67DRAFT_1473294 [Lyophyllum atratum]
MDLPPSYDRIDRDQRTGEPSTSNRPVDDDLPTYNAVWTSSSQTEAESESPNISTSRRRRDPHAASTTFPIGSQTTEPLVFVSEVRGHLALLHAFATLRWQVDAYDITAQWAVPFVPQDTDMKWAWFVGLAVERFSAWCNTLGDHDAGRPAVDFLPPLDVLMVWHAYMLNPRWYSEDTIRIPALRFLAKVGPIFSSSLSFQLEKILNSEPSSVRLASWCMRTLRAFDPFEDALLHPTKEIRCPKCRRAIEVEYMNVLGTGYLQQRFFVRCPSSGCKNVPKITKTVLGLRKLAEDLVRQESGPRKYLAGTLRTPQKHLDFSNARVKKLVMSHSRFLPPPEGTTSTEKWIYCILERNKYHSENMRAAMAVSMHVKCVHLIRRIFSAYADGEMFSLDLVGAVIRQGTFIKKMHELRWTEAGFFNSEIDEVALHHAIARYHAFLDLLAASPKSQFAPTLDIDLVWHTHQLMGPEYNSDCKTYVGRYIDHNDKIEEGVLASTFEDTCRAWRDRFDIPYTHCGCPVPGESIGKKLSILRTAYSHSKTPPYLDPPLRADLTATHPSDHNAVFLFHRKGAGLEAQKTRREKYKRRQARDGKDAERHDPAFLVPVPMYFTYPADILCAATPGHVVNNTSVGGIGGCAEGGGCAAAGPDRGVAGLCWVG